MATVRLRKTTDPAMRALLEAAQDVYETEDAHTAAVARFDQALALVAEQRKITPTTPTGRRRTGDYGVSS
jgi:hypothetical protein